MIAKLRGILDSTGSNWAVLDVNGVFYRLFCSAKTLDDIGDVGQECIFYTEMQVREDLMALYGFGTQEEKEWFNVLISVQGVGMKVGLAILSVASAAELHSAILAQDKTTFTNADGVGPKLATRLVNELKDKVAKKFGAHVALQGTGDKGGPVVASSSSLEGAFQDAVSALINLGYRSFEVNQAVAFLKQDGYSGTVEEIIPMALGRLSKKA